MWWMLKFRTLMRGLFGIQQESVGAHFGEGRSIQHIPSRGLSNAARMDWEAIPCAQQHAHAGDCRTQPRNRRGEYSDFGERGFGREPDVTSLVSNARIHAHSNGGFARIEERHAGHDGGRLVSGRGFHHRKRTVRSDRGWQCAAFNGQPLQHPFEIHVRTR